jgi:pimeloyl-ACP methyl ester carboxylesterase
MHVNADGTARPHSTPEAIGAVIDAVLAEDWEGIIGRIHCPTLLINATGPYGPPGTPPILSEAQARETVDRVSSAQYVHVPGNHVTMIFGRNASYVVAAIDEFVGRNR